MRKETPIETRLRADIRATRDAIARATLEIRTADNAFRVVELAHLIADYNALLERSQQRLSDVKAGIVQAL